MSKFRVFLIAILAIIVIYTAFVVSHHGLSPLPIFFGDILRMEWPGQFNLDFLGFLILSAFWTAWRNQFAPNGLGLALLAFFFGTPFLTIYLLVSSFRTDGDVQAILMRERR